MKILFLTSRFPYPLEKGDKLRAYYQLRSLSAFHEVFLVSIFDGNMNMEDLEKVNPYTKGLYLVTITPMERFFSLIRALFTGMPFQIAWFYSHKIKNMMIHLEETIKPDHVYCQLPRMAEYGRKMSTFRTLDYMDCFGIGMKRRASVAKGFLSWLYRIEAERMIRYEASISKDFNNLTIISEQDKNQFSFQRASEIKVVPNGIDKSFYNFSQTRQKEYDIVFVGNLSYLPNIEAAEYLVLKILPLISFPVKIIIAGASPSGRVRSLENDVVAVKGWVDDIRDVYASGRIFVAPMFSGTGQQNKILEAMSMGLPCVTTKVVNNAIGADSNTSIVLAETPEQFAAEIEALLKNEEKYDNIRTAGRLFITGSPSWEDTGKVLSDIFAKS